MTTAFAAATFVLSLALGRIFGLSDPIKDLAAWCAAIGTILAFLTLVGRSRPGRWLGRTLVGNPLSIWMHRLITQANAPRFDTQDEILAKLETDTAACRKELRLNGSDQSAIAHVTSRIEGVRAEISGEMSAGFADAATERHILGERLGEVQNEARSAVTEAKAAAAEARLAHAAAKQNEITNAAVAQTLSEHLKTSSDYGATFVEAGRQIVVAQTEMAARLDSLEQRVPPDEPEETE